MSKISITRKLNAPIEKVWEALTTPDSIMKYWAPEGMKTPFASIDKLEAGGLFRYCMEAPNGFTQWVQGIYQDVNKSRFLSYIESLTDADGNEVPPSYYRQGGDEIVRSLTEFALDEADGVTTLIMTIDSYGDPKGDEMATQGWKGMLDKLAKVVE